ncbi:MAG TPA: carboxymuconolactone decarboxylase family protein [Clostridia bacterium]|nr:carboxymuconolactone decarboxylase family protein [Clostridia bacterium]
MSRIPELRRDALDADAQRLYDEILAARGSIAGPFRVWLYSPEFTRRATQLGEFLRYHTSLPPRLSELVILITARLQKSEAQWAIHEPLARKAGLPANVIEALGNDIAPTFDSPEERAIYEYCHELHLTHTVVESTMHQLIDVLGKKAAIEATGLCGYYTMVAMTLNAFGIAADADADPTT